MCDFISNYILTSDGLKTALQVTTGVIDPDGNDRKVTDRFVVDITRPYDIAVAIDALTVKVALENGLEASFKEDHLLMTNSGWKSVSELSVLDSVKVVVPSIDFASDVSLSEKYDFGSAPNLLSIICAYGEISDTLIKVVYEHFNNKIFSELDDLGISYSINRISRYHYTLNIDDLDFISEIKNVLSAPQNFILLDTEWIREFIDCADNVSTVRPLSDNLPTWVWAMLCCISDRLLSVNNCGAIIGLDIPDGGTFVKVRSVASQGYNKVVAISCEGEQYLSNFMVSHS